MSASVMCVTPDSSVTLPDLSAHDHP
jgi:hypothetical protein